MQKHKRNVPIICFCSSFDLTWFMKCYHCIPTSKLSRVYSSPMKVGYIESVLTNPFIQMELSNEPKSWAWWIQFENMQHLMIVGLSLPIFSDKKIQLQYKAKQGNTYTHRIYNVVNIRFFNPSISSIIYCATNMFISILKTTKIDVYMNCELWDVNVFVN